MVDIPVWMKALGFSREEGFYGSSGDVSQNFRDDLRAAISWPAGSG